VAVLERAAGYVRLPQITAQCDRSISRVEVLVDSGWRRTGWGAFITALLLNAKGRIAGKAENPNSYGTERMCGKSEAVCSAWHRPWMEQEMSMLSTDWPRRRRHSCPQNSDVDASD
jgi:hypothetical protein